VCGVYGLPVKFLVTDENGEPKNIGMNVSLNLIFNVLEDMKVNRTVVIVNHQAHSKPSFIIPYNASFSSFKFYVFIFNHRAHSEPSFKSKLK
jgi:hypothetical protein